MADRHVRNRPSFEAFRAILIPFSAQNLYECSFYIPKSAFNPVQIYEETFPSI